MAINFTFGQLLTSDQLNDAFDSVLDLTQVNPQTMVGPLNLGQMNASISVTTEDIIVSGVARFNGQTGIHLASGPTLTRPTSPSFGDIHVNSDSGQYELYLASGNWANILTTSATSGPSNPPINPSPLSFGQASSSSIPLAWMAPGGGTAPFVYNVQYRLSGTTNWITWATNLNTTSTTISGLLPSAKYEFQVISINTSGQTASPVGSTATLGYAVGGPTNVSTFGPTSTTVSLTWNAVSSPVPLAYIVNYAANGRSSWTASAPTSDTLFTVSGLQSNTLYNFQVVVLTSGGSFESTIVQGTTAPNATVAPNAATSLVFSNFTVSSATVSWTPPSVGTAPFAYQVQYQIAGGAFVNYKTPTVGTSVTMTSLVSGQAYFVRVQTVNSAGTSNSSASSVTPLTSLPTIGQVASFVNSGSTYPVITGPALGNVGTNGSLALLGIGVDDPQAAYSPGTMSVMVTAGVGTVTMSDISGNKILGSGTSIIATTPMTLAALRQALSSLSYTASAAAGSDTVIVTVADQFAAITHININITISAVAGSPSSTPPPSTPPSGGVTSTGQPTDGSGTQAGYINNMLGQFGVGVSYETTAYGASFSPTTAAVLENNINYIGRGKIKYVRARVGQGLQSVSEQQFMSMIAQNCGGLKYILALDYALVNPSLWTQAINIVSNFIRIFPQYSDSVTGIFAIPSSSPNFSTLVTQADAFQAQLYGAIETLGVHVFPYTADNATSITPGTFANADYGYLVATNQMNTAPDLVANSTKQITSFVSRSSLAARQSTFCVTEFTYSTFPDSSPPVAAYGFVSESAQAAYVMTYMLRNYMLSSYLPGGPSSSTSGLCLYGELVDNNSTTGLFDGNGVPRIAANALRSMYSFYDNSVNSANFAPGKLNYTVTNKPTAPVGFSNGGYGDALFQRTDGSFILFMWNQQSLNNSSTNAPIAVAPVNVTITFNERAVNSVFAINPMTSQGQGGQAYAGANSASSLTFALPANPIILVITP